MQTVVVHSLQGHTADSLPSYNVNNFGSSTTTRIVTVLIHQNLWWKTDTHRKPHVWTLTWAFLTAEVIWRVHWSGTLHCCMHGKGSYSEYTHTHLFSFSHRQIHTPLSFFFYLLTYLLTHMHACTHTHTHTSLLFLLLVLAHMHYLTHQVFSLTKKYTQYFHPGHEEDKDDFGCQHLISKWQGFSWNAVLTKPNAVQTVLLHVATCTRAFWGTLM